MEKIVNDIKIKVLNSILEFYSNFCKEEKVPKRIKFKGKQIIYVNNSNWNKLINLTEPNKDKVLKMSKSCFIDNNRYNLGNSNQLKFSKDLYIGMYNGFLLFTSTLSPIPQVFPAS